MAYYSVEVYSSYVDEYGDQVSCLELLDTIKGQFATSSTFVVDGPVRVAASNQVFLTTSRFLHLIQKGNLINGHKVAHWIADGRNVVVYFEATV